MEKKKEDDDDDDLDDSSHRRQPKNSSTTQSNVKSSFFHRENFVGPDCGCPEKFYLACAFCDHPPAGAKGITEDSRLLLYALHEQATKGPAKDKDAKDKKMQGTGGDRQWKVVRRRLQFAEADKWSVLISELSAECTINKHDQEEHGSKQNKKKKPHP